MIRRPSIVALLLAVGFVAAQPWVEGAAGAQEAPDPDPAPVTAAAPVSFTLDWSRNTVSGVPISTSSPVLVDNGGNPFVAVGDVNGNLRAYDLDSGSPVAGWSSASTGFVVRAPLSTDGSNVYVPVAQDGKDRYPQYRKYAANGSLVWNSNPGTSLAPTSGFMLAGVSLAHIGGTWRGFAGSSSQWFYGLNTANGSALWGFRNADSTMATPALADLYGLGVPQMITSNDTTAEFPWDRHGGILRILTHDGRQICTATQLVSGDTYAASGYNNSSPAVAEIGGQPLIVFGSTGPVQTGAGGNQIVGYTAGCALKWASPPLAAQAQTSPTFADARGTGSPQVIVVVGIRNGAETYPRVYVLSAVTGNVLSDSGTSLKSYGALLAYPPSVSVVTADVNGDGAQDLFVPSEQGSFLVLNGKTLGVIATIPTNLVVQNTPILTAEPGGIRVTLAGYNGYGGVVSSYVLAGGGLGANGWPMFGHDPQLTGLQGALDGPYNQLLEGQTLPSGGELRSSDGSHIAAMQADGNLVVRTSGGSVRWASDTHVAGSRLVLGSDGDLQVRSPGNTVLWKSGVAAWGTERLVLGTDGTLKVYTGTWAHTRRLTSSAPIWSSAPPAVRDRLGRKGRLQVGQSLVSAGGAHRLTLQTDGNLVLYRGSHLLWQSGTRDTSRQAAVLFGDDGNVVIHGSGGRVLRDFGLAGRGGTAFVVGSDGVLRVTNGAGGAVWQHNAVK